MSLITFLNNPISAELLNKLPQQDIVNLKTASKESKIAIEGRLNPEIYQLYKKITSLARTSIKLNKEVQELEANIGLTEGERKLLDLGENFFNNSPDNNDNYYADQNLFKRIGYFFAKKHINLPGTSFIQNAIKSEEKAVNFYKENQNKADKLQTLYESRNLVILNS